MSIYNKPPQGTHFADGLRTGAEHAAQYSTSPTALSVSPIVSSASDTQAPGVFNTPLALLNVIPAAVNTAGVAAVQTPGAAGYLTLVNTGTFGVSQVTYQSVAALQLDCARNLSVTTVTGNAGATFTVFGWDKYGQPMVENIVAPVNTSDNNVTTLGRKAFYVVRAIFCSAATNSAVSVGIGNIFGLDYLLTQDISEAFIPMWNSKPDITSMLSPGTLGMNPLQTGTGGTGTIFVNSPSPLPGSLTNGDIVTISGATSIDGVTAAQLNISAPITIFNANSFTYPTAGTSSTGGTMGGGNLVSISFNVNSVAGQFVLGNPVTATATSGDVRGTYAPSTVANGTARLFINYYTITADSRNYYLANTGSRFLNNNPLTTNTNTTVSVTANAHQLINGQQVTISGATTFNGATAAALNVTAPITVTGINSFTYQISAAATGTGAGGGSSVIMSPASGALASSVIGRYGVTQYTQPLI